MDIFLSDFVYWSFLKNIKKSTRNNNKGKKQPVTYEACDFTSRNKKQEYEF